MKKTVLSASDREGSIAVIVAETGKMTADGRWQTVDSRHHWNDPRCTDVGWSTGYTKASLDEAFASGSS